MGKNEKPSDDEPKPTVAKSALELQRFKLEKLMKNPEKPVVIPDRPRDKRTPHVPEFVRNVMGSSAGAGSGEFHVYRHLRRKEYARQKFIQEKSEKQLLEEAYHQKLLDNKQAAEEKTAKKRAKRLKKKASKKLKRQNQPLKKTEIEEKSDTESDDSDEGKDDQADEQTCSSSISDINECTNPRTEDTDQRLPLTEESHSHYSDTSVKISREASNTDAPISSETNIEIEVEPGLGDVSKRNVDKDSLRENDIVKTVNKNDVTESEPE